MPAKRSLESAPRPNLPDPTARGLALGKPVRRAAPTVASPSALAAGRALTVEVGVDGVAE